MFFDGVFNNLEGMKYIPEGEHDFITDDMVPHLFYSVPGYMFMARSASARPT